MAAAPLQYVGVFRNHDIADVVDKAKVLSLAAVQLMVMKISCISTLCVRLCQHTSPSGRL